MDGIHRPTFSEDHIKLGWFSSVFRWIQRRTKAVTVTTTYTVADDVWLVRCDASGGAFTVSVPLSLDRQGRQIAFIKIDDSANNVTIERSGSDTINGETSHILGGEYYTMTLGADGTTHWNILCRYPPTVLG